MHYRCMGDESGVGCWVYFKPGGTICLYKTEKESNGHITVVLALGNGVYARLAAVIYQECSSVMSE